MLVGEATYGKGLIQRVFPLPDGGDGLKLTIGEYLRPTKQHVRRGVARAQVVARALRGDAEKAARARRRTRAWRSSGRRRRLADAGAVADRGSSLPSAPALRVRTAQRGRFGLPMLIY